MRDGWLQCSSCRRTPVPGEFVHRLSSERLVCSLCLAKVPAAQRDDAVAERVHASERHVVGRSARRLTGHRIAAPWGPSPSRP